MRILALETTTATGAVAALSDRTLLGQISLQSGQRSAQALAPALRDLFSNVGWQAADVQLIAVTQGPGSFTGLRVGVTTAKTLAYVVGAELVGVDTLEVIAAGAPGEISAVSVVLDAGRDQVFAADFVREDEYRVRAVHATRIIERDAWLAGSQARGHVSGPGLRNLIDQLPPDVIALAPEHWPPQAAIVGQTGLTHYLAGRRDDHWTLVPNYYRKSAAEERLEG